MANYSSVAFDLFGLNQSQSHTNSTMLNSSASTVNSESNFQPFHSSTPTSANQQNKRFNRPLRLLNVNFQSITGKKAETRNLIDSTIPDIILGTESHLDPTILSSEILPEGYNVFRRDRNRDGGGVLIAVADHLQCQEVTELSVPDCEIIWVKIRMKGSRQLLVASYYRPHTKDKPSLDHKNNKPWVDYTTSRLIRRRDKLYKRWKKTGDILVRDQMKALKRLVQRRLRQAYWSYTGRLFADQSGCHETPGANMKRFWTYIKSQRTEAASVAPIKVNGRLVTEAKDRAEALNKQFHSAFSQKITYTEAEFWSRTNLNPQSDAPTCSSINIVEAGVRKLMQNLNPRKAPGPDGISPRLLKELANELAPALTLLFQSSLETGIVPQDWRTANVTPVYKKGERYRPENYRPISLTSIPCKIMEHIVTSTIMSFAEENNIICENQHGFRRRHSCESQLLGLVDDLSNDLEQGKQTDALIMDFSKAFDKVCHSLLIHKLKHYGIRGPLNTWIQNFLADRTQVVVVEGSTSNPVPVESGVPQGSVLGPSLFLLYINDLPTSLSSIARLFADDTLAHKTICSASDQELLQVDLDLLAKWEQTWLMEFHPGKCQSLHITRKRAPLITEYHLHGHTLSAVKEAKYLGVTITNNLTWSTHIGNIVNKASKTLGFLRRNLKACPKRIREIAYFTLVRPIVEFASPVWDPHIVKDINRLEQVQRRAARWVSQRFRRTSSVNNMLEELQWIPLRERRRLARLTTFYKYHTGALCINMQTRPTPNVQTRATRQSHSAAYRVPQSRTSYRQNSFFPRTIPDWNTLDADIALSPSLEEFRGKLQLDKQRKEESEQTTRNNIDAYYFARNASLSPVKPLVHLTGSTTLRYTRAEGTGITKVTDWETRQGLATLANGMMYNNGDLIIPQDGFYYVYSQVYYRFLMQDQSTDRPYQMIHYVLKQTSYPEPQEILKSVRTSCWSRKAEFGLHTSFQGGLFRLQRGDRIWVACSNLHLVSLDETASFFGAFLI
ncbi:hypothetical protein Bbelb_078350 [Branchiostoma belcheri]|nr:hypothetical protein Bbelb_078350 [Branchiostoma belcheri]